MPIGIDMEISVMTIRRSVIAAIVLLASAIFLTVSGFGFSQNKDAPPEKKKPPLTGQILMRDKLTYANKALEGLSVEDFNKVAESAEMMRIISKAASWYVIDNDEYARLSKNFQEQAADMERHAKEKNLDAAALDYMRISLTCVQCHKYMREVKKKTNR
jgi:hypothetical protein